MKKNRTTLAIIFIALLNSVALLGQDLTADQIQQALLAQPPQAIRNMALALADENGVPAPIKVSYVNTFLDTSRSFNYFVAFYSAGNIPGGFLRVFRREGISLTAAGDQDVDRKIGGFQAQLELIDVTGDGVPEIQVISLDASGNDQAFSLFIWTGTALHDMLGNVTIHSRLADIDNDGIPELIHVRDDGSGFNTFKLFGNNYKLINISANDPTGLIDITGNVAFVSAFCKQMEPDKFSLSSVNAAFRQGGEQESKDNDSMIHMRFGELHQLDGTIVDAGQIDLGSVVVSPHIIPRRTHIGGRDADESVFRDDHKNNFCLETGTINTVNVEISRLDLLRALQTLQPDARLRTGDQIDIRLSAKLKDNTPISAVFKAKVIGDNDPDDSGHHVEK